MSLRFRAFSILTAATGACRSTPLLLLLLLLTLLSLRLQLGSQCVQLSLGLRVTDTS